MDTGIPTPIARRRATVSGRPRGCRFLVPIAVVLALLTGAALADTWLALGPATVEPPSAGGSAAYGLVRAWYAAANRAIATGDASALSPLLAPGFVDHAVVQRGDASGLAAYLAGLHGTHPAARLAPLELGADGDRVIAHVRVDRAERGTFLGLPVADTRIWGSVDVFRMAGGAIAEHWGDGLPLARFAPLADLRTKAWVGGEAAVVLERRGYPPGAGERLAPGWGVTAVAVESGALRFAAGAGGYARTARGEVVGAGAIVDLGPGDALILDGGGAGRLDNVGTAPALALALRIVPFVPVFVGQGAGSGLIVAPVEATPGAKVAVTVLAGDPSVALPAAAGGLDLALGRIELSAGGLVAVHAVAGAELVAVEEGTLALETAGAPARVLRASSGARLTLDAADLGPGDGATADRVARVRYGGVGTEPAVVLVVRIGPATDASDAG